MTCWGMNIYKGTITFKVDRLRETEEAHESLTEGQRVRGNQSIRSRSACLKPSALGDILMPGKMLLPLKIDSAKLIRLAKVTVLSKQI